MKGRPPKPVEQKVREGNPGKRKMPARITLPPSDDLEAPKDWDPLARECWEAIVPTLKAVGIVQGVDRMALEALCLQWARARKAADLIRKQGMFAKGSTGQLVEHPAVATERNAHMAFLRFAEQYALTPSARTRLGLAEIQRQSMQQELEADLGKPKLQRVK